MGLRETIDKVDELGRRIKDGENGELFKQFRAICSRYLRWRASTWGYPRVDSSRFEDFCQQGIEAGFHKWDGKVPLLWRVQNAFRDAYRDYLRRYLPIVLPDPDQEPPPPIDSPGKEPVRWLIIKETAELVLVELQKEKRPCPQVVRMRIWEKMPYEEIALIVGLSVSRCRGVYFDNKKAVKRRLLRKYPGEFRPFTGP